MPTTGKTFPATDMVSPTLMLNWAHRILLLDPQDDPGPVGIKDPEEYRFAYPPDAGKRFNLLHLLVGNRHRRTGKDRPGQLLGHVAGTLHGDVCPDLLQGRAGCLAVGHGEGIEDDEKRNAYGKAGDGRDGPALLKIELPYQIV
jgi:hypothetical protein